ncbi:MAG TPA: penicillin-insensitive murein endopeptidase, partial [Bauldia sp.]|nr:penicillin-insensitive murein endopeptidase [Bauldia sp.]
MLKTLAKGALAGFLGLALVAAAPAPDMETPAKTLFGGVKKPSDQKEAPIGFYAKGCLAGAVALPIDGPAWQVMRLSRNRNWGTPELVSYLEKFATDARRYDGWPGLLIGDMSQPRGGPMASGHASHQIGLDVDIWYDKMPDRTLTAEEREKKSATSLTKPKTHFDLEPANWPAGIEKLLKRAASYPEVERIFVNPGIKKRLCDTAGPDRAWLAKLRPFYLHNDHFHVRLRCPAGAKDCIAQTPPASDDGCGKDLEYWLSGKPWEPPPKPVKPVKPKPPLTLAGLPKACTGVLYARDAAEKT